MGKICTSQEEQWGVPGEEQWGVPGEESFEQKPELGMFQRVAEVAVLAGLYSQPRLPLSSQEFQRPPSPEKQPSLRAPRVAFWALQLLTPALTGRGRREAVGSPSPPGARSNDLVTE